MSDEQLGNFNDDLGKLGYVWQFITLAGFHSNGLVVTKLARSFGDEGMLAYVRESLSILCTLACGTASLSSSILSHGHISHCPFRRYSKTRKGARSRALDAPEMEWCRARRQNGQCC